MPVSRRLRDFSSSRHAATRGPSFDASVSASSSAAFVRFASRGESEPPPPALARLARTFTSADSATATRDAAADAGASVPARLARNVSTQMLSALCRIFASDVSAFATLRVPPHAFAHAFGSIVESSDATLARRSPPPLRRVEGDGVPRLAASPLAVSIAFAASTTSVSPSEHKIQVSSRDRFTSVTSGSALTNCFSLALPNARETASTASERAPTARNPPARGLGAPPGGSGVGPRMENLPAASAAVARESPTLATNMRGKEESDDGGGARAGSRGSSEPGGAGIGAVGTERSSHDAHARRSAPLGPSRGVRPRGRARRETT